MATDLPNHLQASSSADTPPPIGASPTRYHEAILEEMTSRLEEARKQGQKVAEIRKSGEIDALHEQLGSKNK